MGSMKAKVYKVTVLVVDLENRGTAELEASPNVMRIETREIDWHDDHPFNHLDMQRAAFEELFGERALHPRDIAELLEMQRKAFEQMLKPDVRHIIMRLFDSSIEYETAGGQEMQLVQRSILQELVDAFKVTSQVTAETLTLTQLMDAYWSDDTVQLAKEIFQATLDRDEARCDDALQRLCDAINRRTS